MIDYEVLRFIWWLLVGVLLIGFAVTDGFDMGVGMLTREQIAERWAVQARFTPSMPPEERTRLYGGWKKAVERARGWVEG